MSLVVTLWSEFHSQGISKKFTCFLDGYGLHGERKGQNHKAAERGRMCGTCLELGLLLTILDTLSHPTASALMDTNYRPETLDENHSCSTHFCHSPLNSKAEQLFTNHLYRVGIIKSSIDGHMGCGWKPCANATCTVSAWHKLELPEEKELQLRKHQHQIGL